MSDNKPVRRSPRLAPPIPPAPDVNAAKNTAKKSASVASNQSKPLRRSPRLASAPATENAALTRLRAQGIRRSPRLNGSTGPDPCTLPESWRKSGSVKGRGSLGKPETRLCIGNTPTPTPRFGSSKIVTVVEVRHHLLFLSLHACGLKLSF
jgi:hypothetical protein